MDYKNLKVIVVDDSKFIRKKMVATLQKIGIAQVEQAEDGEVGIAKISEQKFDVAFLDINMPNIDGLGVIRHLKESGVTLNVIVCSSLDTEENIEEIKALGVNNFVCKPFSREKLEAALENLYS